MPKDHDPAPEPAEPAMAATIDVEHDGATLTFPADVMAWPYEAGLALEQGKNLRVLELLLPADQHRRLVRSQLTVGGAQAIVAKLFAAIEARNAGESSAS